MKHPVLKTSTALGLSLSLLQPGVAPAQEPTISPELRALCVADPEFELCRSLPEEVLRQILEEAEAAEGAPPEPAPPAEAAPAEGDSVAPPGADPEPAPEALQDAPAEILPGSTPPEPRPEAGDTDALTEPEAAPAASDPAAPAPAEVPAETETEAEAEAEAETGAGTDAPAAQTQAESEPATDPAAAPAEPATVPQDPEPATEALEEGLDALDDAEPETETDVAAEAEADAGIASEAEAEAEAGTDAEIGAGTGAAAADAPATADPATAGTPETATAEDPAATDAEAVAEEEPPEPLDPEQEAALEAISADPEVAQSLSVLERSLAGDEGGDATEPVPAAVEAAESLLADPEALPEAEARAVTGEMSRSSAEDVAEPVTLAAPTEAAPRDRDGLTDFEQIGLGALAGLVVGMTVANNRVAATSADRVVVVDDQGDYEIWRDDDALLRRPGVRDRIERFDDGSTVTTIFREDGARIVTVRDATGRAIRRDRIAPDGRVITLFDDTRQVEPVRVSTLPPPRRSDIPAYEDTDPARLREILAQTVPAEVAGRFTLAQVRNIVEVRRLAPELAVGPVTFATGSAAIRPEQADRLAVMAGVMTDIIDLDPTEVFLIEGHTDAVGRQAYNLLLSDRRAESVALALTEYFDVPPENMVVQGYGERFLRVPTATAEPLNRRVTVRRVTDLIR